MAAPSDPHALLQYHMIRAHYTFTTGFDTIARLLEDPPTKDLKNFLGYCLAWAYSLVHHHDTEELTVFPFLNTKMDFAHEQDQHKIIHDFLDKFVETVKAAQADTSKFDAAALLDLMHESKEVLFDHLSSEISHIAPANLRDAGITGEECHKMVDDMEKHAKNSGDPFLLVPFMRGNTPAEYKDSWPEMPWVLRKVVIPYMLALRYSGYWKYAPYPVS